MTSCISRCAGIIVVYNIGFYNVEVVIESNHKV